MSSLREKILQSTACPLQVVKETFMGETVWVREFTEATLTSLEKARYHTPKKGGVPELDMSHERARAICLSLFDGPEMTAKRIFEPANKQGPADEAYIQGLPGSETNRLYDVISKLNKMQASAVEDAEKNSEPTSI